ncbi:trifunctional serine/threonine-protein kinase/ATP-binding protein/sensor histidine kinase [Sorangium sp. So ce861]|uniref:trifunctional serine/threonine-protein kinase/ATP-binding protein/sensor histidine kinase n=1 Tax=Sorangium sp. So ce861 TaxID=3133323 RepID=UPI003F5E3B82
MVLPTYEIQAQVYDSINTRVCRALRAEDGAPILLKILKPLRPSPERLAWFQREYEMQRGLDLPCVPRAYGLGLELQGWTMAIEDFGGESLDRLLRRGTPRLDEALGIALRIVDALGQIHERRIIHKDINPSNIVWSAEQERLAIIDFGISTALSRESPVLKSPGVLDGTLLYIAPEQTGRTNRSIDYRTDFYSLGVTLYELFTGALPFTAQDAMELVHCHLAKLPTPPHARATGVPRAVSDVVMRLLEKAPEARYQSTYGIKADLAACLASLRETGTVGAIELGARDVPERFQIPQKLYGREREVEALLSAFERVAQAPGAEGAGDGARGAAELLLVTGTSGIGKSALVRELYEPITRRRGYFIRGKYDQLQRATPYAAVVAAFRSLVRQILGESQARLARWQEALRGALGPNGQVVLDVIPEVEAILGPQPPVPELGPTETQNRFNLVLERFLRVFAKREHPLVIFLDDLQWADAASLRLLERVLGEDRPAHLFLIGAYRDGEVGPAHPLTMTLEAVRAYGTAVHEIHLGPLAREHVEELLGQAMHAEPERARPLAELVLRKTEGNPLFVSELLKSVHKDGFIAFDRQRGLWQWDLGRIEAKGVTDSIIDLMIGKIRSLPAATQQALSLGACMGSEIDLRALSLVAGQSEEALFQQLFAAALEGLLLPASELEVAQDATSPSLLVRHYRFLHDRVQQAAYALVEEAERPAVHLRIGRLLLAKTSGPERAERIFQLATHLNQGRGLVTDPAERLEVARLNLEAGKRAKSSTAYAAAREFLAAGLALLPEGRWEDHHDLTADLHRELAEAEALNGDHARAEALTRALLDQARTPLEQAGVYDALVSHCTMVGRYAEAIDVARRGLALLGIDLPERDLGAALEAELAEVDRRLGDRPAESLLNAPAVEDPAGKAALELISNVLSATFYVDRQLYALAVTKSVGLSLQYGLAPRACSVFAFYGMVLSGFRGQQRAGYEMGALAVRLGERFNSPGEVCKSCFALGNFTLPWVKHLRVAQAVNDAGYKAGLEAGELRYAGYILIYKLFNQLYEGTPLPRVLADLPEFLHFNQKNKNQIAIDIIRGLELAFAELSGGAAGAGPDPAAEAEHLAACEANQSVMALCYHHILKTQILYLHGDPAGALAAATRAEALLSAVTGNVASAAHQVHHALCLAALADGAGADERRAYLEAAAAKRDQLGRWAEVCPETFSHMHALVGAELARLAGATGEAVELYERAITSARAHGFLQDEALASELYGRFWLRRGKERLGRDYLADARCGFELWGARRKVALLDAELGPPQPLAEAPLDRAALTTTSTRPKTSRVLDLGSVLKASQAIASELVLERLLTTLMTIVIENAGAERGVLLLAQGGELIPSVEARVDPADPGAAPAVTELDPAPPPESEQFAESIAVYVQRTREGVLLGDAAREGDFTQSPYIARNQTRSVLCMPLLHHGKLIGVLYLENNLAAGAFTQERLEVLRLLSAQMAVSIENAVLYGQLEQRVGERTAELRKKNADLEEALQHLKATQVQLVQSEKMASLGQLTAGIAHEIKNPLHFINNFAEANVDIAAEILDDLASNPGLRVADIEDRLVDLKQISEKIAEHGRRTDGIVRGMMRHASGGTGERQSVGLNGLLEQYVSLAYHGMRAQKLDLNVIIERDYDEAAGEIELVPQEIGRVMVNLLTNAFDALREKQRSASGPYVPTLTVSTRRLGREVEIRVRDNGVGVPDALRAKIFHPFFTTKPTGQGTGLGLSMSYDIVRAHRGTIRVDGVEGEGATFIVALPG